MYCILVSITFHISGTYYFAGSVILDAGVLNIVAIVRWHRDASRLEKNGLPHGLVQAPTLFNLYTNDLPATKNK